MTRGRLVVHGHFYQPSRVDPFSGVMPQDPSAAPAHDWNERISEESYRPNAERGNFARMSWDLGPTLAAWLQASDPIAYQGFVAGDRGVTGMAQPFHHTILPLASAADRRTEVRWGLRDFEWRFGRRATAMWVPEAAVDLPTLRLMAEAEIRHTILAPWQANGFDIETRRPYRVELGDGRSIVVAFYDGGLSTAVSFDPDASADADRFAAERVLPRLADGGLPEGEAPVVVIATDGELYGHHQPYRDMFLARLVEPNPDGADRAFDVVALGEALAEPADRPFASIGIVEGTSWSCHHGLQRWSTACPCVTDGRWKAPLRGALDRLAAGIDVVTSQVAAGLPGSPDPWPARDGYVDVVIGAEVGEAFAGRWLERAGEVQRGRFLDLMEAQRWRLAMFASCGWFWDEPVRPETFSVLRAAARAARLVDPMLDTDLERRLVADLALFTSPERGIDGAEIYRQALEEVGQPAAR